jgi:hypothetical protein
MASPAENGHLHCTMMEVFIFGIHRLTRGAILQKTGSATDGKKQANSRSGRLGDPLGIGFGDHDFEGPATVGTAGAIDDLEGTLV